jgi:hypothetical protein
MRRDAAGCSARHSCSVAAAGGQGGGEARAPREPFGDVDRAGRGARSGCEAADAAGHRVHGRRARAHAAVRVDAARAALEEVPHKGDPRVLGDAAVRVPLGGG